MIISQPDHTSGAQQSTAERWTCYTEFRKLHISVD